MEYYVDHRENQFYIITNADGKNYKVHIKTLFSLIPFVRPSLQELDLNSDLGGRGGHKSEKKKVRNPLRAPL